MKGVLAPEENLRSGGGTSGYAAVARTLRRRGQERIDAESKKYR